MLFNGMPGFGRPILPISDEKLVLYLPDSLAAPLPPFLPLPNMVL